MYTSTATIALDLRLVYQTALSQGTEQQQTQGPRSTAADRGRLGRPLGKGDYGDADYEMPPRMTST